MSTAANNAISQKKIAVIIPISADTLAAPRTINDIRSVMRSLRTPFSLVLVRNGLVKPHMAEYLEAVCFSEATIHCITLGSKVSKQLAIRAGMEAVVADAYVSIAADGTDDVRAIAQLVRKWNNGSDCVLAAREDVDELTRRRRIVKMLYRAVGRRCAVPVAYGATDFCLLDRKVVEKLLSLPCDDRNLAQQTSRLGFRRSIIGMEASWRRPESMMQRGINHLRSLRESLLSHSRMPIRSLYWAAASVFGVSIISSMIASSAIALGASTTFAMIVMLSACLYATSTFAISAVILAEYLYRLMQNGPAAKSYAV